MLKQNIVPDSPKTAKLLEAVSPDADNPQVSRNIIDAEEREP